MNRRAFPGNVAVASVAAIPSLYPKIANAAPAELVIMGDRLAAAYAAHGLSMAAVAAADQRMREWEKSNPFPQLPNDIDEEDERWAQILASHEGAMRERGVRRVAACFEFRLAKTKEATFVTEAALQDAACDVAEFDAETLPALIYKARLASTFDFGGNIANSITYDLLAMGRVGYD